MKWIKRLYFKLVPTYKRTEFGSFPWSLADRMIKDNEGKPEHEKWIIAKEEDSNFRPLSFIEPHVYLEKRIRILE